MSIPPISGSADWEPEYEHGGAGINALRDILREGTEEISIEKKGNVANSRLLAICRNVLRGGKPELIFNVNLYCKYSDLKPCPKEHKRLGSLPALVGIEGNKLPGYNHNKKYLQNIIYDKKLDDLVISPFLKICLYYYIEHSDILTQTK